MGTRPDQKQMPLLYEDKQVTLVEHRGYLCYPQIKIWQEKNMTNDIRTSFAKTEG